MLKIKKVLNSKIVSIIIACVFILNNAAYGIDLSNNKTHLRVPMGDKVTYGRMSESMQADGNQWALSASIQGIVREAKNLDNTGALSSSIIKLAQALQDNNVEDVIVLHVLNYFLSHPQDRGQIDVLLNSGALQKFPVFINAVREVKSGPSFALPNLVVRMCRLNEPQSGISAAIAFIDKFKNKGLTSRLELMRLLNFLDYPDALASSDKLIGLVGSLREAGMSWQRIEVVIDVISSAPQAKEAIERLASSEEAVSAISLILQTFDSVRIADQRILHLILVDQSIQAIAGAIQELGVFISILEKEKVDSATILSFVSAVIRQPDLKDTVQKLNEIIEDMGTEIISAVLKHDNPRMISASLIHLNGVLATALEQDVFARRRIISMVVSHENPTEVVRQCVPLILAMVSAGFTISEIQIVLQEVIGRSLLSGETERLTSLLPVLQGANVEKKDMVVMLSALLQSRQVKEQTDQMLVPGVAQVFAALMDTLRASGQSDLTASNILRKLAVVSQPSGAVKAFIILANLLVPIGSPEQVLEVLANTRQPQEMAESYAALIEDLNSAKVEKEFEVAIIKTLLDPASKIQADKLVVSGAPAVFADLIKALRSNKVSDLDIGFMLSELAGMEDAAEQSKVLEDSAYIIAELSVAAQSYDKTATGILSGLAQNNRPLETAQLLIELMNALQEVKLGTFLLGTLAAKDQAIEIIRALIPFIGLLKEAGAANLISPIIAGLVLDPQAQTKIEELARSGAAVSFATLKAVLREDIFEPYVDAIFQELAVTPEAKARADELVASDAISSLAALISQLNIGREQWLIKGLLSALVRNANAKAIAESALQLAIRLKQVPGVYPSEITPALKALVSVSSYMDFLAKEKNEVMLRAKLNLLTILGNASISPEQIKFVVEFINRSASSERLAACRGLSGLLNQRALTSGDTLEEWEIALTDYRERFGYLAQRDMVLVHRYLYHGINVDDIRFEKLAMDKCGVNKTGEEGIKQLQEAISKFFKDLIKDQQITQEMLAVPLYRGFIGSLTGYYSSQWGHGSARNIPLDVFVRRYNQLSKEGRILPLADYFKGDFFFSVHEAGSADFSPEALKKFEEYRDYVNVALILAQNNPQEQVEKLRAEVMGIIDTENAAMDATLLTIDEGKRAKAAIGIEQKRKRLRDIALALDAAQKDPLAFAVAAVSANAKLSRDLFRKQLVIALLLAALNGRNGAALPAHGELLERLQGVIAEGVSATGVLIDLWRHILTDEHVLKGIEEPVQKELGRIFDIEILEVESIKRSNSVLSSQVRVFATKSILGEMAADFGDACYSQIPDIMARTSPSQITSVLFTSGEGLEVRIIGSMLLLENTSKGKPVLILRAINPSEEFLANHSADDFLAGVISYAEKLAERKGGALVVAPVEELGALSNRARIIRAAEKLKVGEAVNLDLEETFNNHDITTGRLFQLRNPHAGAESSLVSAVSSPLSAESRLIKAGAPSLDAIIGDEGRMKFDELFAALERIAGRESSDAERERLLKKIGVLRQDVIVVRDRVPTEIDPTLYFGVKKAISIEDFFLEDRTSFENYQCIENNAVRLLEVRNTLNAMLNRQIDQVLREKAQAARAIVDMHLQMMYLDAVTMFAVFLADSKAHSLYDITMHEKIPFSSEYETNALVRALFEAYVDGMRALASDTSLQSRIAGLQKMSKSERAALSSFVRWHREAIYPLELLERDVSLPRGNLEREVEMAMKALEEGQGKDFPALALVIFNAFVYRISFDSHNLYLQLADVLHQEQNGSPFSLLQGVDSPARSVTMREKTGGRQNDEALESSTYLVSDGVSVVIYQNREPATTEFGTLREATELRRVEATSITGNTFNFYVPYQYFEGLSNEDILQRVKYFISLYQEVFNRLTDIGGFPRTGMVYNTIFAPTRTGKPIGRLSSSGGQVFVDTLPFAMRLDDASKGAFLREISRNVFQIEWSSFMGTERYISLKDAVVNYLAGLNAVTEAEEGTGHRFEVSQEQFDRISGQLTQLDVDTSVWGKAEAIAESGRAGYLGRTYQYFGREFISAFIEVFGMNKIHLFLVNLGGTTSRLSEPDFGTQWVRLALELLRYKPEQIKLFENQLRYRLQENVFRVSQAPDIGKRFETQLGNALMLRFKDAQVVYRGESFVFTVGDAQFNKLVYDTRLTLRRLSDNTEVGFLELSSEDTPVIKFGLIKITNEDFNNKRIAQMMLRELRKALQSSYKIYTEIGNQESRLALIEGQKAPLLREFNDTHIARVFAGGGWVPEEFTYYDPTGYPYQGASALQQMWSNRDNAEGIGKLYVTFKAVSTEEELMANLPVGASSPALKKAFPYLEPDNLKGVPGLRIEERITRTQVGVVTYAYRISSGGTEVAEDNATLVDNEQSGELSLHYYYPHFSESRKHLGMTLLWLMLLKDNRFAGRRLTCWGASSDLLAVFDKMPDFATPAGEERLTASLTEGWERPDLHVVVPHLSDDHVRAISEFIRTDLKEKWYFNSPAVSSPVAGTGLALSSNGSLSPDEVQAPGDSGSPAAKEIRASSPAGVPDVTLGEKTALLQRYLAPALTNVFRMSGQQLDEAVDVIAKGSWGIPSTWITNRVKAYVEYFGEEEAAKYIAAQVEKNAFLLDRIGDIRVAVGMYLHNSLGDPIEIGRQQGIMSQRIRSEIADILAGVRREGLVPGKAPVTSNTPLEEYLAGNLLNPDWTIEIDPAGSSGEREVVIKGKEKHNVIYREEEKWWRGAESKPDGLKKKMEQQLPSILMKEVLYKLDSGILSVIAERPWQIKNTRFKDMSETPEEIKEKINHSVLFVAKKDNVRMKLGGRDFPLQALFGYGPLEWHASQVPMDQIEYILVPQGLEDLASKAFTDMRDKIIVVGKRVAEVNTKKYSFLSMEVPDYESALNGIMQAHPDVKYWVHGLRLPVELDQVRLGWYKDALAEQGQSQKKPALLKYTVVVQDKASSLTELQAMEATRQSL